MKGDVERLIKALAGAELAQERKRAAKATAGTPVHTVVTVSRSYGAQGKAVAQRLAERLGVCCYDRELLQAVARQAQVDIDLVKSLDEHVKRIKWDGWQALGRGKRFSSEQYLQQLIKVILGISHTGGVIVGRGAHLILGPGRAFRVRIVASASHCVKQVAEREKLPREAARRRVVDVNRERSGYIRQLYDKDIDDSTAYDLVLNSDRFSVDAMVDGILCVMQQAGYSMSG